MVSLLSPAQAPMFPGNSQEFINLIAHYYRGEIARMAGWRDRIDRTTNWAITCVAAMLSISWSGPAGHHEILLFAMLIVFLLLVIESRRYRFFDVYRRRVRSIERYYYAQVFDRTDGSDLSWTVPLGDDLRLPRFAISQREAFCRRLRRNYIWLFTILLVAWMLQMSGTAQGTRISLERLPDLVSNASVGALPGVVVTATVCLFYVTLVFLSFLAKKSNGEVVQGQVHV